jgi:glutaredoxin 3
MSAAPADRPLVEIYTGPYCSYCHRAKDLLTRKGLKYNEFDISSPLNREEMMRRLPRARTIPQIFIDGEHIGGCEDLELLHSLGELDRIVRGEGSDEAD